MKRVLAAVAGIVLVLSVLWWVAAWAMNGGWPASGPVGASRPVHVQYVRPADGDQVADSNGFCVHFYYPAGRGMDEACENAVRYFIDGKNVTRMVVDVFGLEYGYPDPVGEPCYHQPQPLRPGWHTAKVTYTDVAGERFEYMWRFHVVSEE